MKGGALLFALVAAARPGTEILVIAKGGGDRYSHMITRGAKMPAPERCHPRAVAFAPGRGTWMVLVTTTHQDSGHVRRKDDEVNQ